MTRNARVEPPAGDDTEFLESETYRIRGETVAAGGVFEWINGILAERFAGSPQRDAKRRWDDLKRHIVARGLTEEPAADINAGGNYFTPRKLAAHAALFIVSTGQIIRLRSNGHTELVTLDDLRAECAAARRGYKAIQAIDHALDARQPFVLAGMNALARSILLGT